MWTELEQLSTVPVRSSIFGTLTAFQDLRVCQSQTAVRVEVPVRTHF